MKTTRSFFFLTLFLYLLVVNTAQAVVYSVTDLGTLNGANFSNAASINNSGEVVGSSFTIGDGASYAVRWSGGTITDLGGLGGAFNFTAAINDAGAIVGYSQISSGANHATLWDAGGITDLNPVGSSYSRATSINNSGQVVGVSGTDITSQATLWDNGTVTNLGQLSADDINNVGQIVGSRLASEIDSIDFLAVLKDGDDLTDLGAFGDRSGAHAINDAGQIVGYSGDAPIDIRAVLWDNGTMVDLGTLGATNRAAYDINSHGQVVGYSYTSGYTDGEKRAFLWEGDGMVDLNTLLDSSGTGWTLNFAGGINDLGQIVGYGTISGQTHAYLLNPVPLPPSPLALRLRPAGTGWDSKT